MIEDLDTGAILVRKVRVADAFWSRLRGLIGVKELAPDEGLLLMNCASVHTFFMQIPIDVAYLDRDGRVVAAFPEVRPWRIIPGVRDGEHTLEVAAGALAKSGVKPGHALVVGPSEQ